MAHSDLGWHKNGIVDLSDASTGDGASSVPLGTQVFGINFATHLVLQGRSYYDVTLFATFKATDSHNFGIAFRYIDPFNYYAVEFRRNGALLFGTDGYKRIIKVTAGQYQVLAEKADGGFNTEEWYEMALVAKGAEFTLYVKSQKADTSFNFDIGSLEEVLHASDSSMS